MTETNLLPCAVPLVEQLERVPADARACYEHDTTSHTNFPYGSLCNQAAAEIRRLSPSPWVAVSDRLPEAGVPVLAWSVCEQFERVAIGWRTEDLNWFVRAPFANDIVTHWQPLPEGPKGGA